MYKYVGYVWPGMIRVTPEEARDIFKATPHEDEAVEKFTKK